MKSVPSVIGVAPLGTEIPFIGAAELCTTPVDGVILSPAKTAFARSLICSLPMTTPPFYKILNLSISLITQNSIANSNHLIEQLYSLDRVSLTLRLNAVNSAYFFPRYIYACFSSHSGSVSVSRKLASKRQYVLGFNIRNNLIMQTVKQPKQAICKSEDMNLKIHRQQEWISSVFHIDNISK